jgi:uncharacterized protein (TIGR01777 family)
MVHWIACESAFEHLRPPWRRVDVLHSEELFKFKHMQTIPELDLHKKYGSGDSLRVLISGSSGMVGSQLIPFLRSGGHEVIRLVRQPGSGSKNSIQWNPTRKQLDPDKLENFDVIIHLGGVNLASRLWTKSRKNEIRESRVNSTKLLAEAISRTKNPPRVLICASAVGIYGDRENEVLTEMSQRGTGFLSDVVKQWESACKPSTSAGIRVANLRFGIILSPDGGALKKMIIPFKIGLGAIIGSGRQFMPWIAIGDVLGAIYHIIHVDEVTGPVNLVAPEAVTNHNFSHVLGRVINRPVLLKAPAWVLKKTLGEMAKETLLVSTRAKPQKLIDSGYSFLFPELESTLLILLAK